MDRRKAITALFSLPAIGIGALEIQDEEADHVNIENNTAVTAIRFNGKMYALGFELVPGDTAANAKLSKALIRCFQRKMSELAPFV